MLDLLILSRLFLDSLIRKELAKMPTQYTHRLLLSCPSTGPAMASLTTIYEVTLGRGLGSFGLSRRLAPDANSEQSHWMGSDTFTGAEVDVLRPYVSPGGSLYLLGIRARRAFNDPTETTSNQAGKTQVTVYDVGDTIPPQLDWETGRVTEARFLADQSLVILEDAILPPASPARADETQPHPP